MNNTFFSNLSALALAGLGFSLFSTSSFAGEYRGEYRCSRLPHDACRVTHRGQSCWYSGGRYFRCHPQGGYVLCERPVVNTVCVKRPVVRRVVVERPVVERRVICQQVVQPVIHKKVVVQEEEQPVVEEQQPVLEEQAPVEEQPVVEEQPAVEEEVISAPICKKKIYQQAVVSQDYTEEAYEEPSLVEDQTVVEALPSRCHQVVVRGERCWESNGVYYRHCQGGYRMCHSDRGIRACHNPASWDHSRDTRHVNTCKVNHHGGIYTPNKGSHHVPSMAHKTSGMKGHYASMNSGHKAHNTGIAGPKGSQIGGGKMGGKHHA